MCGISDCNKQKLKNTWVAWEASSFLLKVTKAYLDKIEIEKLIIWTIFSKHLNLPLASVVDISHSTVLLELALNELFTFLSFSHLYILL